MPTEADHVARGQGAVDRHRPYGLAEDRVGLERVVQRRMDEVRRQGTEVLVLADYASDVARALGVPGAVLEVLVVPAADQGERLTAVQHVLARRRHIQS